MELLISGDGLVLSHIKQDDFDDLPSFNIRDGYLVEVSVPYSPSSEVYYTLTKDKNILFSDDFLRVVNAAESLSENKVAITHFIEHWTFPTGLTHIEGVFRLIPGKRFQYKGCNLIDVGRYSTQSGRVYESDQEQYRRFKAAIDKTISESASSNMNALYLSGGVDSVLIGLVFQKLSIPFKAFTSNTIPSFKSAIEDESDSAIISKKLGWEHEVIVTDLNSIDLNLLDDIRALMPMSSHLAIHFIALSRAAKSQGINVVFSGQNMDSLYNLGPTSRISLSKSSLADLIRRMFLTTPYFNSLIKNENLSEKNISIWGMLASLASFSYSKFKKDNYSSPRSCSELVRNYKSSNDYAVFTKSNSYCSDEIISYNNSYDVRSALLDYKVNNFLMTGAPQVIYQSGKANDLKVVLPYSSKEMVDTFYGLSMSYQDILFPKRYVYRYIQELAGIPYSSLLKGRVRSSAPDYQSWVKTLLEDTQFGRSLSSVIDTNSKTKGYTPAHNLQRYLAEYWLMKTREDIKG